jgi:hypothetical protein
VEGQNKITGKKNNCRNRKREEEKDKKNTTDSHAINVYLIKTHITL